MKYVLFFLMCILTGCLKSHAQPIRIEAPKQEVKQAETLVWYEYGNKTFAQAIRTNRLVIVFVELPDDEKSEIMHQITFKNPEVIRLLNENYIMVKLNGKEYTTEEGFTTFPTAIFMSPYGYEFGRLEGVALSKRFVSALKETNEHRSEVFYLGKPQAGDELK